MSKFYHGRGLVRVIDALHCDLLELPCHLRRDSEVPAQSGMGAVGSLRKRQA